MPTYRLPPAIGEGCEKGSSSINGGKVSFTSKNLEVYKVFVRKSFLIFLGKLRARSKEEMSIIMREDKRKASIGFN
jgi:hypothetical protein